MNWYIYKVYYFIKPIVIYIIKNSTSLLYNKKKKIHPHHMDADVYVTKIYSSILK